MAEQPRYDPLEPSKFFPDGLSARPLVPGVVPRDYPREDPYLSTGLRAPSPEVARAAGLAAARGADGLGLLTALRTEAAYVDTFPFQVSRAVLERGRARYRIFCAVCHDEAGTGGGKIVQRGFTRPPSFHADRSRKLGVPLPEAPVGHYFEVITHGFGAMPDYRAQIPPADRWAVVAYIRALQKSQNATLDDVPEAIRPQLQARRQAGEAAP